MLNNILDIESMRELKDKSKEITQKLPQRNWQVKILEVKLREMGDRMRRFNIAPRISYMRRKNEGRQYSKR